MLDFVGIGAQKTGTTWLHAALSQHPQVRFPAGKEVHFWDRHRSRGTDWYRARFSETVPGRRNGEITPAYAILSQERIAEARALDPGLRIIYTIRNPIDRAWSSALMLLTQGDMTADEASDQWFIDHIRSRGSLLRGDYETCIRNWRHVFPPEQLLLLSYERLCKDPLDYLQACCRHIDVDPGYFERERPAILTTRVYEGRREPLRESLRALLHELYAKKIERLSVYLGVDLTEWLSR